MPLGVHRPDRSRQLRERDPPPVGRDVGRPVVAAAARQPPLAAAVGVHDVDLALLVPVRGEDDPAPVRSDVRHRVVAEHAVGALREGEPRRRCPEELGVERRHARRAVHDRGAVPRRRVVLVPRLRPRDEAPLADARRGSSSRSRHSGSTRGGGRRSTTRDRGPGRAASSAASPPCRRRGRRRAPRRPSGARRTRASSRRATRRVHTRHGGEVVRVCRRRRIVQMSPARANASSDGAVPPPLGVGASRPAAIGTMTRRHSSPTVRRARSVAGTISGRSRGRSARRARSRRPKSARRRTRRGARRRRDP